VTIYWQLAGTDPDAYLTHLAEALRNLTIRLVNLDRPTDAAGWATKAVAVNRLLRDRDPATHAADLARALYDAAVLLDGVGDRPGAGWRPPNRRGLRHALRPRRLRTAGRRRRRMAAQLAT